MKGLYEAGIQLEITLDLALFHEFLGKADGVAGLLHADLLGGSGLDDAACHFGFGEMARLRRRHADARGFEHRLKGGDVLRPEPGGVGVGEVACNDTLADGKPMEKEKSYTLKDGDIFCVVSPEYTFKVVIET